MESSNKKRRVKGEGSIFQRSDGIWVIRFGGQTKYAPDSLSALDKLNDMKASEGSKQCDVSVTEIAKKYLRSKKTSMKPTSFDRLESTIDCQIIKRIGKQAAKDITYEYFHDNVLTAMKDAGLGYSSIKKAFDAFNGMMRFACAQHLIKSNPLIEVKAPAREAYTNIAEDIDDEGVAFALDKSQREKFKAAAECTYGTGNYRFSNHDAYIFMMYTGLRMGEMIALKWSNVDMDNKSIRVCMNAGYVKDRNEKSPTFGRKILTLLPNTKNNRSRVLKLNNNAYTALIKLKEIAVAKNSEFVVSGRNGTLVRPKSISNSFSSICDIAKIKLPKGSNVHALRHTFASMLFEKGVHVRIVSELLGHSSVQITMNIYIHLIQDQKLKAMEAIDVD